MSISVRDYGVQGDGTADDTDAFARAITSFGTDGGVLQVPDGVYLIDPVKSVRLTSNVTLNMSTNATLKAIPSGAPASAVILIDRAENVSVYGGNIIGERSGHLGSGGEEGMGVSILASSNVRIDGVHAQDCWGDGFYIAGWKLRDPNSYSQNVTISRCTSRNNRRQGLSIVGCVGALIEDSEFTDTNGTEPQCGIDLEPHRRWVVRDVTIRNCLTARNSAHGIQICGNDTYDAVLSRVTLENNRSVDNGILGAYILRGSTDCTIVENVFARNQKCGLVLDRVHYNSCTANVFTENSLGNPGYYADIYVAGGASHNTFLNNKSSAQRRLAAPDRPVIVVAPDSPDNVVEYDVAPSDSATHSQGKRSGRP